MRGSPRDTSLRCNPATCQVPRRAFVEMLDKARHCWGVQCGCCCREVVTKAEGFEWVDEAKPGRSPKPGSVLSQTCPKGPSCCSTSICCR